MMSNDIKQINFYGQVIETFEQDGEKWVGVKSVCDGIGIDRKTQQRKIESDPKYRVGHMTLPSKGGIQRSVAIPVTQLDAWLSSINANKVREDLRDDLLKYQKECMDALHSYWNQGVAINPRHANPAWREARAEGISVRNDETDVIKKFVAYAHNQGSKNAHWYYRNITRATYKGLELIEKWNDDCENLRENLEKYDLGAVATAEMLIQQSLMSGMELELSYKEIYRHAATVVKEYQAVRLRATMRLVTKED